MTSIIRPGTVKNSMMLLIFVVENIHQAFSRINSSFCLQWRSWSTKPTGMPQLFSASTWIYAAGNWYLSTVNNSMVTSMTHFRSTLKCISLDDEETSIYIIYSCDSVWWWSWLLRYLLWQASELHSRGGVQAGAVRRGCVPDHLPQPNRHGRYLELRCRQTRRPGSTKSWLSQVMRSTS